MTALDKNQIEILRRVRAGRHLGGGDVPLASLESHICQMIVMRLIKPAGARPYRLTAIGVEVLNAAAALNGAPP